MPKDSVNGKSAYDRDSRVTSQPVIRVYYFSSNLKVFVFIGDYIGNSLVI